MEKVEAVSQYMNRPEGNEAVTGMRSMDMQRKKVFIFSTWGFVTPASPPSYESENECISTEEHDNTVTR